jgi:Acetyltransferase (GNAT) domain
MLLTADTELSYEFLARKFGRLQRKQEDITYETTRDPGYLHQYYLLRENMFIHVCGLGHSAGQKDAFDDQSDIMVARVGNHVIGGCRLTFSTPKSRTPMPLEKNDFDLGQALPDRNIGKATYMEISRMAILPEYQNSVVMLELSRRLLKYGIEKKARYAFTLAPAKIERNYHKAAALFNLEWQILNDVEIPDREEYEGIRMALSMLDMASVYPRKRTNKKTVVAANSFTAA